MPELLTYVLLSAAAYRIARFVVLDSLVDEWRDSLYLRLLPPIPGASHPLWRSKLADLMVCSYCSTVWTSAAVVLFYSLVLSGEWIGWWFLIAWPAVSTGALVFWSIIDSE